MSSDYRRLWTDYIKPYRGRLLVVLVLMAIGAAVSAGYAKFVQMLIDGIQARDLEFLYIAPVVIVALTTLKGIAYFCQLLLTAKALSKAEANLQNDLYHRLVHTDMAHLQSEPPAAIAARFSSDVGAVRAATEAILNGLSNALVVVATFGVMLSINWFMTIGLLGIFILSVWPVQWIGRKARAISGHVQGQVADMTGDVNEGLAGIRLVRTYRLEGRLTRMADALFDRLRAEKVRLKTWTAGVDLVMEVVGGLALAGLLALVAFQISRGQGVLSDFIALLTGLGVASAPARRVGNIYTAAQVGAAALARVFGLLDRPDRIFDAADAQEAQNIKGAISFRDVGFHYPDGTRALTGVNLNIGPGERVAFVGRSGAGKTTIFNILPRLFDPSEGEVSIDGRALPAYTIASLRSNISVVSQDSVLLSGTIAENIGFGREGATREAIEAAARDAEAHEFITALPKGYDTVISPTEAAFSGGERQRLSIARAILRDAPILLLDEPTSALDAKAEAAIKRALDRMSNGRTTLIIAHRLSTIRDADRIVVMQGGQIIDMGKHDELIKRGGVYAELYALQAGTA